MAIQNSARAGAARMMANSVEVMGCGSEPAIIPARLVNSMPQRPPSPVGRGQLAGMATKEKTPENNTIAPIQETRRNPGLVTTWRRAMAQPQSASGTTMTSPASPRNWKVRSAITAPG